MLRRDLRTGGSYGRVFMAVDGTLITRTEAKGIMSSVADTIVEEYWRLEEGGNVLVARQCAYHVRGQKRGMWGSGDGRRRRKGGGRSGGVCVCGGRTL
jgi:hypothetical protein